MSRNERRLDRHPGGRTETKRPIAAVRPYWQRAGADDRIMPPGWWIFPISLVGAAMWYMIIKGVVLLLE